MNILITGGLGFIGASLVRLLSPTGQYKITIVDNLSPQIHGDFPAISETLVPFSQVDFIRCSAEHPSVYLSALTNADVIVHLAAETGTAQSMYQIARYNAVNTQATANILDTLANNKNRVRRIILASSRSIYGEGAYKCVSHGVVYPGARTIEQLRSHEWDPTCPHCSRRLISVATPTLAPPNAASIYAATKYAQEDLIRIASSALGIDTSILRFQNVYGAGQSLNNPYTGILSIFSTRIRRGLSLPIFEDGQETRDFVHVSDVANAIRLCIDCDSRGSQIYNVGSGIPTSVMEIATMLVRILDGMHQPHVTGEYRIGDIRHCYADISQFESDLGYSPKVSLEEGLRDFGRWVMSQPLPHDGLDNANKELKKRNLMN
ncbi:NAD-dependent epimerase/dehydratase family protein [Pusillimonas noertemannii]|uniref:dTDP-L-rhamnose 4-epimerase n=1 Tax=Pusillimonas noertemannii TaxID=305977 RepID=A0A2U1CPN7_9BURK|nr:NAD-dependent epimerase/dehydratase family protein [Pusillimonas noertemannii]NYT67180.1 NAD-dependent epimerase/dehydratase family protein [Pusillimonas noertemannii]PVY67858.1 dTDP-L-rhamnose 4-epimerase [Pusillimonas noertemannii]TFL12620.1 NAD-dependent epimerase/dehydratase family protein [Pusillimonas noertemannii]